jgi:hypothetical protein
MHVVRKIGNLKLNHHTTINMYNVSDEMLMQINPLGGVSVWLDSETVENLKQCSNERFITKVNELINI